jgi:hypothetical protein
MFLTRAIFEENVFYDSQQDLWEGGDPYEYMNWYST